MLSYQFVGDRGKPTIVLLHGFLGSGADFYELTAQLTSHFACLLIDLPGHGQSNLSDEAIYSMPATALLVVKLLDELQLQHVYLYGYSMGGRLALYLAIHHKTTIRKTLLESASPGLHNDGDRAVRQQQDNALANQLEQMTQADFQDFLQHWYAQPLFQSLRQHPRFSQILGQRSLNQPRYLAKSLRQMGTGTQPSLWQALAQHDRPLHLVTGGLDQKFVTLQAEMQHICPVATSCVIQQAGHNLHLENPAAMISEIISFFEAADF
jgi:2-succinyl-6-hydroxy-2,4-cyclohexadiene-1-carboxylate synthase